MEFWSPRAAARYTLLYFPFVLAVVTVLELLFWEVPATLGDAVVRSLPLAVGMAGGLAFVRLARWRYEREAA